MSHKTVDAQDTSVYSLEYHERPETNLVTLNVDSAKGAHKVCQTKKMNKNKL